MSHYTATDFDYDLPSELIAQHPLPQRAASRLLLIEREHERISHQQFFDLTQQLQPNDLLVLNNTKVIPARLFGQKLTSGKLECLVERILADNQALAHIRSSKSPKIGTQIILSEAVQATVINRVDDLFQLQFPAQLDLLDYLQRCGRLPLPPYIEREPNVKDYERYQTVYAKHIGAVAAPTAGLHFDTELLTHIKQKNISIAHLTLHVGAGTFQPLRVNNLQEHVMHAEVVQVDKALCEAVRACKARGGRVVAVGTTVVRALETAAQQGELEPYQSDTRLFIYPGFRFRVVDALITNFHLPQSTLLMLVSAFGGYDLMRQAYAEAIAQRYRFFSYGDAMFIS